MRDRQVNTGPGFTWVDQKGREHNAAAYPRPSRASMLTRARRRHADGQQHRRCRADRRRPRAAGSLGSAVAGITPGQGDQCGQPAPARAAPHAPADVGAEADDHLPRDGLASATTRVFAQLVDDANGEVLGHQITPIPVTLDGKRHTITLPLEIVAAADAPGEHFTLQITPSTVAYAGSARDRHDPLHQDRLTIPGTKRRIRPRRARSGPEAIRTRRPAGRSETPCGRVAGRIRSRTA